MFFLDLRFTCLICSRRSFVKENCSMTRSHHLFNIIKMNWKIRIFQNEKNNIAFYRACSLQWKNWPELPVSTQVNVKIYAARDYDLNTVCHDICVDETLKCISTCESTDSECLSLCLRSEIDCTQGKPTMLANNVGCQHRLSIALPKIYIAV